MSRKTVSRGTTAVALATLLTLAGAAPTLAASRHASEPGLKAPTSVWGLVLDFSEHLMRWALGAAGCEKTASSSAPTDNGVGADPNGAVVNADPSTPIGIAASPTGGGR